MTKHWKRRTSRPNGLVKSNQSQAKGWMNLLRLPLRLSSLAIPTKWIRRNKKATGRLQGIQHLPSELILEVAEWVTLTDVLNLSLTCSRLRKALIPVLYDSILLDSSRHCELGLAMLAAHPEYCPHVRKMAVRPNYYLSWPRPDELVQEDDISQSIVKLTPHLKGLHTFDWDGRELPPSSLWEALRENCPSLTSIYCNIGIHAFPLNYELFSFSNLETFVMTVGYGLAPINLPAILEPLPNELWEMLDRCPDLEELTICSFSTLSRALDLRPVTQKRWPKLHSLTLGSFGYETDPWLDLVDDPTFATFISAHPGLKYLQLQWDLDRWMAPHQMLWDLPSDALPKIESFVGIYQQLEQLPNLTLIESLDLTCEPLQEIAFDVVLPVLKSLTSLTSLDIWVHPPPPSVPGHESFLSRLLGACPGLNDLHLRCTSPNFTRKTVQHLLSALTFLPSLKIFSLTKMYKLTEKSMLDHALWILQYKPNLELIKIRWAHEKCRNHLKQEGCYEVTPVDNYGRRMLHVHEKGIPLYGKAFDRRYKRRLPPLPTSVSAPSPLRRRFPSIR